MKYKIPIITLLFCLVAYGSSAKQQENYSHKGLYVGISAGVPFSHSSFSSFAKGGPYGGVGSALSAGYRFNSLLSLEADLGLGRSSLAAQGGCIDSNYYLAADGKLYYASLLGMQSWSVKDFKSSVSYGHFGISANFNLLSLVQKTALSRWSLELSPRIAAYGTQEKMLPLSGGDAFMASDKITPHFAYGAALKASYRISRLFRLGLSSSFTSLTGRGLDGIPDHGHKSNFIWENSLQLSCDIIPGSRKGKGAYEGHSSGYYDRELHRLASLIPVLTKTSIHSETSFTLASPELPKAAALATFAPREPLADSQSVHFAFDKWNLTAAESRKLLEILDSLRADANLRLSLEGWCDRYGSDEVNLTISRLRAESVKKWFTDRGIEADRIELVGKGSDKLESNNAKARRVDVQLHRVLN